MKIVAILMVKNEDLRISWVVRNIVDFCDKIYAVDNYSEDDTYQKLQKMADKYKKMEVHQIRDLSKSHDFVAKYAGTHTWILGVDGDEVYDPSGLKAFRRELESGKYNKTFSLYGHTLNCIEISYARKIAKGYITPTAKSVTKLYNFNAIDSWEECPDERLHGGKIRFREGWHYNLKYPYMEEYDWSSADFRCLHTCFMRRSSLENDLKGVIARKNIYDMGNNPFAHLSVLNRKWQELLSAISKKKFHSQSRWKLDKYAVGALVEKSIDEFFLYEDQLNLEC